MVKMGFEIYKYINWALDSWDPNTWAPTLCPKKGTVGPRCLTAPAGPNCPGPNLLGDAIASKKEQLLCKVIHYLANDK